MSQDLVQFTSTYDSFILREKKKKKFKIIAERILALNEAHGVSVILPRAELVFD